jgi:hypothetical protein
LPVSSNSHALQKHAVQLDVKQARVVVNLLPLV